MDNSKQCSLNSNKEASIRRNDSISVLFGSIDEGNSYKYHRNCYLSYTSEHNIIYRKEKQNYDAVQQRFKTQP